LQPAPRGDDTERSTADGHRAYCRATDRYSPERIVGGGYAPMLTKLAIATAMSAAVHALSA